MSFREIIIKLLGLEDVIIEDIKLFKFDRRMVVRVRQKRQSCHCRHCGLQFNRVKDWDLKTLRAPPMGIYQFVTVKFMQLRGTCESCNKTAVAEVDWIHQKFESMTCGFAETAGRLMEEITCEAVGRILESPSKTMWDLDQHRMAIMLQYLALPEDLAVSYLCADEVHFRTIANKNRQGLFTKRWRPEFVTNLVCPSGRQGSI